MADPKFADVVFGGGAGGEPESAAEDATEVDEGAGETDKENGRMLRAAIKNGDDAALAEAVRRCCGM